MMRLQSHDEVEPGWALLFASGQFVATTRIGADLWRNHVFTYAVDVMIVHPSDRAAARRSHRNYVVLFVLTRIGCT
jgi:hypothetical protein